MPPVNMHTCPCGGYVLSLQTMRAAGTGDMWWVCLYTGHIEGVVSLVTGGGAFIWFKTVYKGRLPAQGGRTC